MTNAQCGGKAFRTFTPGEPPKPPVISQLTPNGQQILLTVDNPERGLYRVERKLGAGEFLPVAEGVRAGGNQFSFALDTTQANCFRLVQADACFPAVAFPATCYQPPRPQPPSSSDPALSWWLPSAFTPNGDGQNDTFTVIGQTDPADFQLSILNRWGIVLFRTTDPTHGWDGTVGGQPAPTGQYAFQVQNGQSGAATSRRSGMLLLVR